MPKSTCNLTTSVSKHILIVFAHPRHTSFNGALLQKEVETLKSCGHDVEVSDLYAMHFDPVVKLEEFEDKGMNVSAEVRTEVEKVKWADVILFQFPMYWCGPPAILKGWMDRVLQMFSGFVLGGPRSFKKGYCYGKTAILCYTQGAKTKFPGNDTAILFPIQTCTLNMVGFDVLRPLQFLGVETSEQAQREQWLSDWTTRLKSLLEETPMEMLTLGQWEKKWNIPWYRRLCLNVSVFACLAALLYLRI